MSGGAKEEAAGVVGSTNGIDVTFVVQGLWLGAVQRCTLHAQKHDSGHQTKSSCLCETRESENFGIVEVNHHEGDSYTR